jgi:hypothetical protein
MMTATFLQRDSRGRAADLMPIIDELKANGRSLAQIAKELNAKGIKSPRGGEWQATQVARVIAHRWNDEEAMTMASLWRPITASRRFAFSLIHEL